MRRCTSCQSFVPVATNFCPNCQRAVSSTANKVIKTMSTIAGASVVSLTLMACYGAPPDFGPLPCPKPPQNENEDTIPSDKPTSAPSEVKGTDRDR